MSIATEIQRIKANIENAYTKAEKKGATIPTNKNSENLATTIESIPESSEVVINTQEKTATPTKDTQNITPDSGYYLSKVVVNPIPDEYIVPSGSIDITENGTYDITNKSQVVVNVASSGENTLKKLLDYTKSMRKMFYENSTITDLTGCIDYNDTSNVENMSETFISCINLITVPSFDMGKVINTDSMFNNCQNLITLPQVNTSNVLRFYQMFYNCIKLTTVYVDIIKANNVGLMFYNCKELTNLTVLNIKINLQVGSGSSWGHLLTLESLIGLCQQCVNVNASRTLTVGTANMTKLADVYVKFTDSSQTTIDVNAKGENMVQCESTDDGAMTINTYMGLKNWTLQ